MRSCRSPTRCCSAAAGRKVSEVERGRFGWSNELVLHVVEIKNARPDPALEPLAAGFQAEVAAINALLQPMGARLMPTRHASVDEPRY